MNDVNTLIELDWQQLIIALVVGLGVVVGFWKSVEYIATKFGIETQKSRDHKLVEQTARNLTELQNQHVSDIKAFKESQQANVEQSIKHDERIRNELKEFTTEVRTAIDSLNIQMQQYNENRIHDRAQSFEIQKQLNERSDDRDKKIEALMLGNMELLGDKIDQRFSRYVALDGIPENEVEEFDGIFAAYKALNGNHKREEKYKYVKNHMKVIPVESKLKIDERAVSF